MFPPLCETLDTLTFIGHLLRAVYLLLLQAVVSERADRQYHYLSVCLSVCLSVGAAAVA